MIELKKVLKIERGASLFPYKLKNGDKYDSTGTLFINGKAIWQSELINTDKTAGYKGGRLALGEYYGIVAFRGNGARVIKLFDGNADLERIRTDSDILPHQYTLPSMIPNPNHGGMPIISFVQIHPGGLSWDFSHGCLTILNAPPYNEFNRLMQHLQTNDKLSVILC